MKKENLGQGLPRNGLGILLLRGTSGCYGDHSLY